MVRGCRGGLHTRRSLPPMPAPVAPAPVRAEPFSRTRTRSGPHAATADCVPAAGGVHAVLDAGGCDAALLDDPGAVEAAVLAALDPDDAAEAAEGVHEHEETDDACALG